MKYLIVVDMQNDFTVGTLGSPHAAAIIPNVVEKVKAFSGKVIFTRDTHGTDYLQTQEGKKLPVVHCIKDSNGWQICDELIPYCNSTGLSLSVSIRLTAESRFLRSAMISRPEAASSSKESTAS